MNSLPEPDPELSDYPYIKMPEKKSWIGKKTILMLAAIFKELWQRAKK